MLMVGAEPATQPTPDVGPATVPTTSDSAPLATKPSAVSSEHEVPVASSLEQATGRFETALRKAREQYLRDLVELKRNAIKAEDLATANELNGLIDRLGGGAPPKIGKVQRVLVRADQDWQRSPVVVRAGDTLRLTATGTWILNDRDPDLTTYGPDGLRRDGTADFHGLWSVLWARIGYKVYYVGKGTLITAEQDGALEFRSNDFSLGDNRGAITVQVTRE